MQETYTFSRALHLMRYSGAKMKPVGRPDTDAICVINNTLCGYYDDGTKLDALNSDWLSNWFTAEELMGSWVEVKE